MNFLALHDDVKFIIADTYVFMYVCMYVYMYVCMFVYIYISTHTHTEMEPGRTAFHQCCTAGQQQIRLECNNNGRS